MVLIYHNPRCSKSRKVIQLLEAHDIEHSIVEYLKHPPDVETLEGILGMLGMEPRDLMRRQEKEFRLLGLDDPEMSRKDLLAAMAEHPILIERPIVISNRKAAIGRPPEKILEIL